MGAEAFYDSVAPRYEEISSGRTNYLRAVDDLILNLVGDRCTRILDVGTGNGLRIASLSTRLRERNPLLTVDCIEPSTEMRNQAVRNLPNSPVFSGWSEIRESEKYDVVLALWNVIGHTEFAELPIHVAEHLTPDGVFISDFNSRYNVKEYGPRRVAKNVFTDLLLGRTRKPVEFNLKLLNNRSTVKLRTVRCVKRELSYAAMKVNYLQALNYATGAFEKSEYGGQMVFQATLDP
jgi:2-polyprenyl-3-methyl-5-hydroxy-6-metoxy-1,4-benzoquinol methylase